jgi:GNAT superfamily N-acetyltransferase
MAFDIVADNLRQSFRALAGGRPRGAVVELPGVSIASLGVTFQMFNAAFPSEHVQTQQGLEEMLRVPADYFRGQGLRWSFWICEDWLSSGIRRKLSRACDKAGLRLSSDMPGLATERMKPPARNLPALEFRRVLSTTRETLDDFRALGATCFHVPHAWFSEVFDSSVAVRQLFVCWVGYRDGSPVATAATVTSNGVIGVYNVATAPEHRQRGYAEAITRHVIDAAARENGASRVALQATSQGLRLYERLGFEPVTRVLVYNSIP